MEIRKRPRSVLCRSSSIHDSIFRCVAHRRQLTIFQGKSLARPAVLDHEWDAIVELKTDLLGGTRLEAVDKTEMKRWVRGLSQKQLDRCLLNLPLERVVRLETQRKAGQRSSVELSSRDGAVYLDTRRSVGIPSLPTVTTGPTQ